MSDSSETPPPAAPASEDKRNMWMRLLYMILIAVLIGAAQTVLHVISLVQFIIMVIDKGKANAQIAAFGASLGDWLGRAARFQTAQSEEKPWPWSPLT